MTRSTDIFCRVVDNYGDIGVCWRLARQLSHDHGWNVRLWVDDLHAFARLESELDPCRHGQRIQGVDIVHWTQPAPDLEAREVVIEAFACDPPDSYVRRMQALTPPPIWINLEYLSAEAWVDDCHGLPSPQPSGMLKHFFFPGFSSASGGLLREDGLIAARDRLQQDARAQRQALEQFGLPVDETPRRLITLFCYPDAPADDLVDTLAADHRPSLLAVPEGVVPGLEARDLGQLRVARLPFLRQPDYDRLLWCADLNFVRGEDSFVRAQWAARPMVWHIYPQEEAAHLDKLSAWLDASKAPPMVRLTHGAWNREPGAASFASSLGQALSASGFDEWTRHASAWTSRLAQHADLASRLVAFCTEVGQKRD